MSRFNNFKKKAKQGLIGLVGGAWSLIAPYAPMALKAAPVVAAPVAVATMTGCSGGGGGGGDDPVNHNPVITSTPVTGVLEDEVYYYNAEGYDPDGEPITWSLDPAYKPAWMSINSSTGEVSGTPGDVESNQNFQVKVRAEDLKGGYAEQLYNVFVTNQEVFVVWAYNRETGAPISGAQVTLGSNTVTTNGIGRCEKKLPDGDYVAMVKDMSGTCDTYKPGFVRISKTSKLEQEARLFPAAHRDAVNDCLRLNGEVRKWKAKPKGKLFLRYPNNTSVPAANITAAKDDFLELNTFKRNGFTNFTYSDIEEIDSAPTAGFEPGYIKIRFDDSMAAEGGNSSQFSGNEITASYVFFKTSAGKPVHMAEYTASMLGGAETTRSGYENNVLYSPVTATAYGTLDNMVSEASYSLDKDPRPAGNKNLGSADEYDVNLSTYQWNQTLTAPTSIKANTTYETDDGYTPKDQEYDFSSTPTPQPIPSSDKDKEVF